MGVEYSASILISSHSSEGWDGSYKINENVNEIISVAD